jgi:hypothetical protein
MKLFAVDMIYTVCVHCTWLRLWDISSDIFIDTVFGFLQLSLMQCLQQNLPLFHPPPRSLPHPHSSIAFSKKLNKKRLFAYIT